VTGSTGQALGIGLDLGTSGCRAVAIDPDAQPIASASAGLPDPVRGTGGAVEQDPMLWWDAVVTVLRRIGRALAQHPAPEGGAALCVDGTSATLLLCCADGSPTGAALMYNDTRAGDEAAAIAGHVPEGSPARGPGSSLAKLLYLWRRQASARPLLALHQADWVIGRLRDQLGDSDWNNGLKLGFDPIGERWPDWLAALVPESVKLPRVHPPGARLGPIAPDVAALTGLPTDVAICAGTTDSTAAVIATGASRIGDAVTSLGSTLVLKLVAPAPVSATRFGVYSHRLGSRWLIGGASNTGGSVLRRFFDDERLTELSQRIDPESDAGLDYYPLLAPGERFPVADPAKQPRLAPRPPSDALFLQGLLEGIARIERDGYRRLIELGAPPPRRVLSTGGGARNPAWTAIRRRMLGVPVTAARHQDAAYGAALLALRGPTG
jgi:hypothetical protein